MVTAIFGQHRGWVACLEAICRQHGTASTCSHQSSITQKIFGRPLTEALLVLHGLLRHLHCQKTHLLCSFCLDCVGASMAQVNSTHASQTVHTSATSLR